MPYFQCPRDSGSSSPIISLGMRQETTTEFGRFYAVSDVRIVAGAAAHPVEDEFGRWKKKNRISCTRQRFMIDNFFSFEYVAFVD
jgi:hypothetical protein